MNLNSTTSRIFAIVSLALIFISTNFSLSQSQEWVVYRAYAKEVRCLADDNDYIWLGIYGGGLVKLNKLTGEFIVYDKSNFELLINSIDKIAIDKQGNKWLILNFAYGLVKFDGVNWTVYDTSNSGLPSPRVTSLAVDEEGNLWIGTIPYWNGSTYVGGGIVKFDGVNWTVYDTTNSGLPSNFVRTITIDRQGNKWIGTVYGGLAKFDGVNWTVYNTSNSGLPYNYVNSIAIDIQGTVWIGTILRMDYFFGGGLTKFDGVNWTVYNSSNSDLPDDLVSDIAIDEQNNKWIVTRKGLVKFDEVNWTIYYPSNFGLPSSSVRAIIIDKQGNKWIGTSEGVLKFDGINWDIYYPPINSLPHNNITSIVIDTQGNKWIGTRDGGLAKFDGVNWTVYNKSNSGLPDNSVLAIAIDERGSKWIGTYYGGLVKFDGVNWTVYNSSNSGLPGNYVQAIAIDRQGNKWIVLWGALAKFDGVKWRVYNISNSGLPSSRLTSLAIDQEGNIWVGTEPYGSGGTWVGGGLAKFDGANWTVYNTSNSGLPSNYVTAIAIDGQGNKWIGTGGGLAKFDGVNWTVYNWFYSGYPGKTISIDEQGNIWIGTDGGGLAKFDGANWTVYNTSNSGLPSNWVRAIAIDEQGNKWIGTYYGLAVYREGGVAIVQSPGLLTQWSIRISAKVDSLSDLNNFAAIHSLAKDSFDPYDIPKPPAPNSNYVYLYFPHPEWGGPGPYYSKDTRRARDLTNETIEWLFNVKTDQAGKNVLIIFEPDSLFPSTYIMILYDLDARTMKILSKGDNTYTYNSGSGGERHFKLVVGKFLFMTRNFSAKWNLVGIPLSIDSTLSSMFSDDVSTFYIYTYTFKEGYKIDTTFTLGKGFWLGLLDSAVVDFSGIPVKDTISTNLDKYWNIISTPYLTPITKGNIFVERSGVKIPFDSAVSSGWISSALFGYDPRTKSYYLSDTLEPWLGYWFATLKDSLKLIYTPSSTAPSPKVIFADVKSDDRNWDVILSARLGDVLDKLAFFGVRDGASDGIDRFDYPKPPLPPGEKAIQVYFYHPEWNFELGPYFASDIRAYFGDVKSWKFYVRCLSGGEVKLSWDLSQVPGRFNFTLFDVSSGRVVDMRSVSEYVYNAVNNETREFRIDAVTGVSEENTIPKSYALYQNYPNPFNPSTTIEFDIPEKTNVKLIIYDILGREVETLIDKELEPGKYKLNFNATDLPSGVYFYTLRTPKFTKTNKMLLIK
jgi:ligand-binding sensor domain-containing protein